MTAADPNGPFLATCRGRTASRRPLWIMRQAGRYLPEYRAVREQVSFLEMCHQAEHAAEVTLQPLRRYDLDAAILFTDLLVPVEPMGVTLTYTPGPKLGSTVETIDAVRALRVPEPERDLAPMLDTVRILRRELPADKALIGFVGAPFTMACYLVEGQGSKNWDATRRLMFGEPKVFDALLDRIVECLNPLVEALVAAGCDAIQVFDSWASVLAADDYARRAAPRTDALLRTARATGAVAIDYVNGAAQHIDRIAASPAEVAAVDWRLPMREVRRRLPAEMTVQGNLDPTTLFAADGYLREEVRRVCDEAGAGRHIFNLGHGILPQTDPRAVASIVEEVHRC
jgi:uroporphyrinogen decarboxylase